MLVDFTEEELRILKEVVRDVRGGRVNVSSRTPEEQRTHQSPEIYVAKTPAGGIPALTEGSAVGTGTDTLDQPGMAECDVFNISEQFAVPTLQDVGFNLPVYNLGSAAIDGSIYISITRTKYGFWVPATAGGSSIKMVEGIVVGTGTGTGTSDDAFTDSDAWFYIGGLTWISGSDTTVGTGTYDVLKVWNIFEWEGSYGDTIIAVYSEALEKWRPLQMDCVVGT